MVASPQPPVPISPWWGRALVGLPCLFLLLYAENLHCTQYASFLAAALGERHLEDGHGPGQGHPLLYVGGTGLLLRLYATASILFAVFGPALALRGQRRGRVGPLTSMVLVGMLSLVPVLNAQFLGQPVLGERFTALGLPCTMMGLAAAILAIPPTIVIARRRRRLGSTHTLSPGTAGGSTAR